ncbi:hypothetical protein L226DRAFT_214644 [Lentinus tigrinus ALCF2SS1-7]|uniref:uncharacterized protein n=1 Tax=Lentinus tigrinus ALCF2SS1-7 TaxID=1328758 RepID=UPI0011661E81|nr:hypothetical protein L226DRAFT_214644 [Lentinus tigrinus ALCF2SS1-7]
MGGTYIGFLQHDSAKHCYLLVHACLRGYSTTHSAFCHLLLSIMSPVPTYTPYKLNGVVSTDVPPLIGGTISRKTVPSPSPSDCATATVDSCMPPPEGTGVIARRVLAQALRQNIDMTLAGVAPINRIPSELLCVVFEHVRQPRCTKGTIDPYMPLVNIMLVCREWYHIAREHAALWTDVALELTPKRGLTAPRWDAHLLEWSKAAPIDLRLEFSYPMIAQCEEILLRHGGRVRRLELSTVCVASVHELPRMLRALTSPSYLSHLTLSLPNPMEMGTPRVRADPEPMPSLQVLVLDRVVWLPSHPLPALTEVRMVGVQPVHIESLSPLISLAPNLTTLQFTACTLDCCRTQLASSHLIFPRVCILALTRTSASIMKDLLAWLVLPMLEDLQVDQLSLDVDPGQSFLPHPLALRDPVMHLDVLAPTFFQGRSGKRLSVIAEGKRSKITFDATPRGETEWDDWARSWILAIPTILPTHTLTSCRLQLSFWARETLTKFAIHVPNLQHLVVQSLEERQAASPSMAVMMVEALSTLLRRGFCPGLVSIGIHLHSTSCLPGLFGALAERAETGRRLRNLLVCTAAQYQAAEERTFTEHLLRYVDVVEMRCIPERLWPGENIHDASDTAETDYFSPGML